MWTLTPNRIPVLVLLAGLALGPATAQQPAAPPATPTAPSPAAPGPAPAEAEAADAVEQANLSEANGFLREQKYEEAAEVLSGLVPEFPDDPDARLMYGEVLMVLGRFDEARPHLERCAEIEPERERVHFQLATALEKAGDDQGALRHYAREVELNEDTQVKIMARLNRSVLLQKGAKWSEAAAELESVLALDPDELRIYGDLAGLYLQADDLERAEATLERGVEDGYSSPKHFYILGTRFYQRDRYQKAVDAFSAALELNAGYADAERSMGAALDQLGREQEAVKHFRRYLELRPDAPEAGELRKRIAEVGR